KGRNTTSHRLTRMTDQRNSEGAIFAAASFGLIRVIRVNLWLIFPRNQVHMPLLQIPEQHWALVVHELPDGRQVAACTAVGATIEVTSGTATTAASPNTRTISRDSSP